jgi:hypothetical protein
MYFGLQMILDAVISIAHAWAVIAKALGIILEALFPEFGGRLR